MFEQIHEIRKRSNSFVAEINLHKAQAIEDNKESLIKTNQEQLKASKLATGQDITPLYSPAYAKRKGYSKPDLHLTGFMYDQMDLTTDENKDTFDIFSYASYTKYLYRYGDIFGISPKNIKNVSDKVSSTLLMIWKKLVIK